MGILDHPIKIRAKIFASLQDGTIDIHVGYGYGLNDGGGLVRLPREEIPKDCRIPNTYLWVWLKKGEITRIEKMNGEDIEEHKTHD